MYIEILNHTCEINMGAGSKNCISGNHQNTSLKYKYIKIFPVFYTNEMCNTHPILNYCKKLEILQYRLFSTIFSMRTHNQFIY